MGVTKEKISLSFDLRYVVLVLLVIIGVMLAIWRPWSSQASDQTVTVSGETKLSAKPDEYVFYPTYQFTNADKSVSLDQLGSKSNEITNKLKELGVKEEKIKTNASGNDYIIFYEKENGDPTYSLQFTVTVNDLELAQKVQEYLVTTTPTGGISPQASFSESKRKELENQAREEASKDARLRADQMAKNLGFKVGRVKSVEDGIGFDVMPYAGRELALDSATTNGLVVQPGENELNYSVTVVYFIR
jgi:uncharacterized protein YggE